MFTLQMYTVKCVYVYNVDDDGDDDDDDDDGDDDDDDDEDDDEDDDDDDDLYGKMRNKKIFIKWIQQD